MKVGRGNIASILQDREGAILFASGVSDSQCKDESEFNREKHLLAEYWHENIKECLFYFSTISINFLDTPYTRHKKNMEDCVREWFDNHCIIRIGNLIGDKNPKTFVNYIISRQLKGLEVEIRDEFKYMVSGDLLNVLTQSIPLEGKHEFTVTSYIKKVKDCL